MKRLDWYPGKLQWGRWFWLTLFLGMVAASCPTSLFAAKFAGEFLRLGVGARPLGMGSAFVAVADDITAGYWNPAGLAALSKREAMFMHAETFGSLLNHDYLAFGLPVALGHGVGAASFIRLGGGGLKLTSLPDPTRPISLTNRPFVSRVASHGDYALFFSYGLQRWPKIRLGASGKVLFRDLVDNSAFGLGIDLAAQAQVNRWVSAGITVQDATTSFLAYDTGTKESITPTVKTGLAGRQMFGEITMTGAVDADFNFDNFRDAAQFWMGAISADTHFGLEADYRGIGQVRIGSDIGKFSAGAGLRWRGWRLDVAYLNHPQLDNSYRISLAATW